MEGVARIAAICCGVRQRRDNLVKLDHRSRPAMCDQERKRIRFRRTNMKEMDVEPVQGCAIRSEEHTSELQSLMRISYAVFCLKKKNMDRKTQRKKPTSATQSQTPIYDGEQT